MLQLFLLILLYFNFYSFSVLQLLFLLFVYFQWTDGVQKISDDESTSQVAEKFDHIADDGLRAEAVAWLRFGVDVKTADEQAQAGRTVAEFKYNLAQQKKERAQLDWELHKMTSMQQGLWGSDSAYREACLQYFTDVQLARIFHETNGKRFEISEIFPNRL